MRSIYHVEPSPTHRTGDDPPEWLVLSFCHARAAGLPTGTFREFCQRQLPLVALASRLTTEVVLHTLVCPNLRSMN